MTIELLGNRIMVALEGGDTMSKGGLFIPESAVERPQIAKVIAIGPGFPLEDGRVPTRDFKVGDRIVLGKYAGMSLSLDGHTFTILNAEEVIGIVR